VSRFGAIELDRAGESRLFDVTRSGWIAVPAAVNGDPALDPALQLHEYRLRRPRGESGFEKIRNVRVENRCSDFLVVVKKPYAVLLPAHADATELPAPPSFAAHDVGHFVCQRAAIQRRLDDGTRLPGMPKRTQVEVVAGARSARYDLTRVTRVCSPTGLAGDPVLLEGVNAGQPLAVTPAAVRHADVHLVCYHARLARRDVAQAGCGALDPDDAGVVIEPAQTPDPGRSLHAADQFSGLTLEVVRDVEVCLPSKVTGL